MSASPAKTARRRDFLGAACALLALAASRSFAQKPAALRLVAVLLPGTQSAFRSRFEAFRSVLKQLGHVEGRDILIEARWAEDRSDRLPSLALELVALGPSVILTSAPGIAACRKATSTIPIVFATATRPVEQGIVVSLPRPGGNITGVLLPDLTEKMMEVAREALPQARRLAILLHEADPSYQSTLDAVVQAARRFKFEPVTVVVRRVEELALAFDEIVRSKSDALYLPGQAFTLSHHPYLVERSLAARLPLFSPREEATEAGGLLSYGSSRLENFRRAATLVDKILRGAKPNALPVEQPDRFELIVNLKTAKQIGVTVSQRTLLRANRVIE